MHRINDKLTTHEIVIIMKGTLTAHSNGGKQLTLTMDVPTVSSRPSMRILHDLMNNTLSLMLEDISAVGCGLKS